ncbi:Fe-S oxidoreductase [Vibrio cholerae]|nr:Fe-S oxidoreductase [Vibrio cholerae]
MCNATAMYHAEVNPLKRVKYKNPRKRFRPSHPSTKPQIRSSWRESFCDQAYA